MNWKDITVVLTIVGFAVGGALGAERRYAPADLAMTVSKNDIWRQINDLQLQQKIERCDKKPTDSFCLWLAQRIEELKAQLRGGK